MLANVSVVDQFQLGHKQEPVQARTKPSHWVDEAGSEFVNPWPSFNHKPGIRDMFSLFSHSIAQSPAIPKNLTSILPIRQPSWGQSMNGESSADKDKIKATWLGHACFLVELPVRPTGSSSPIPTRGARILFDPVFSDRCSPVQFMGPKRYTPAPCKIEEIPEVDAVVISHNHYDHMDTHTLRELSKRQRPPLIFAPLGNRPYFQSIGIADEQVHLLDWWNSRRIEVEIPFPVTQQTGTRAKASFDITCTPAQHFTGRGLNDRFKTLWSSWAVKEVITAPGGEEQPGNVQEGVKVFFAGDTGYRSVRDGEDEDKVPHCPAFKEIGKRFGGFDLALIPIGAYRPRQFMSPIHCAPQDSVLLFKDIRAKKAIGMHWGTWILTTEDIMDPPARLKKECEKVGIPEGDFSVCDIGETLFF